MSGIAMGDPGSPSRHRPKPHPKPKPGGGGGGGGMSQGEQNAFDTFIGILEQFGFTNNREIAKAVRGMILDGVTDFQQIELGLRDTKAWKQRFAGNEQRIKNGLNALSIDEYLATEKSYSDILHQAGLPTGFYDDPSDFAGWIGGSVSAAELSTRVQLATDLKNREDPAVTAELKRRGLSDGDILASFLDKNRALPILQKKYQSTLIGAAAQRAGISSSVGYSDKLAGMGVTEQQAAAGFGTVADITHPLQELGDVYGQDYSQADAQAEVFENSADAARKRKRLAGQESAAFSGSSGANQGSMTRNSAGSY